MKLERRRYAHTVFLMKLLPRNSVIISSRNKRTPIIDSKKGVFHMKFKTVIAAIVAVLMMFPLLQPAFAEAPFQDVKPGAWYYDYVTRAKELGFVVGVGNNKYAPDKTITKAEYITLLNRIIGVDVTKYPKGTHWATQNILAAEDAGILKKGELSVKDYDKGIFRETMMVYTTRAFKLQPEEFPYEIFVDVGTLTTEEQQSVYAAFKEYLTEGTGFDTSGLRIFGARKTADRAQLAAMAMKMYDYRQDPVAYKEKAAEERAKAEQEAKEKLKDYKALLKDVVAKGGIKSEKDLTPELVKAIQAELPLPEGMGRWALPGEFDGKYDLTEPLKAVEKEIWSKEGKDVLPKKITSVVVSKDLVWRDVAGTPGFALAIVNGTYGAWVKIGADPYEGYWGQIINMQPLVK